MRYSDNVSEQALGILLKAISVRILNGGVPAEIAENPDILGQVVHEVVGGCAVYLMPCKEVGSDVRYVKIGMARDIKKRIDTISTGCPLEIKKALYFCTGSQGRALHMEKQMHEAFSEFRERGEWFRFNNQEEMQEQVKEMIAFAEDYLDDDFSQYVYEVGKPTSPIAKAFVKKMYKMIMETIGDVKIEEMFSQLNPAPGYPSLDHFPNNN